MKGLNLGGWFSQIDAIEKKNPDNFPGMTEHLDSFLGEIDFKNIKTWGFDHVRLPVDWNNVFSNDIIPRENVFETSFCRL